MNIAFVKNSWIYRASIILLLSLFFEIFVLTPGNLFDHGITNFMAYTSGIVSKQFSDKIVQREDLGDAFVVKTNEAGKFVYVGDGCNARRIIFLYIGFILAVPAIINKRRMVFLLGGILGIVGFNIIRIVVLFLMAAEMPIYFEFTHKYLFQAAIYIFIFWLWHWFLSPPNED
jgi:exosortase/archaeosortase family protein